MNSAAIRRTARIIGLSFILSLAMSCADDGGTEPPPPSQCSYDPFPGSSGVMDHRVRWHPIDSGVFLYTHRAPSDEPYEELGFRQLHVVNTVNGDARYLVAGSDGAWSPGGDRIVFSRQPGPNLWILDLDSNEQQDLGPGSEPNWHPVEDKIIYNAPAAQGGGLHVLELESNTRTFLRVGLSGEWSPDGKTVLAHDGGVGVVVFPVEAPDSVRVLVEPGVHWYLHWHPNGRQVTYRDREHQLIIDIETLEVDTLITGSWEVSFSPSGSSFVFSAAEAGRRVGVLFLMATDGSECRQLTSREDYGFVEETVR